VTHVRGDEQARGAPHAAGKGVAMVAVMDARELEELVARAVKREVQAAVEDLRRAAAAPDDLLDTAQAAEVAAVSTETIRDWIARRGLPAHRPPGGKEYRIRRADLVAFLASPTARRPPPAGGPIDLASRAREVLHRTRARST
jgi:excisionase family DNA binding protein